MLASSARDVPAPSPKSPQPSALFRVFLTLCVGGVLALACGGVKYPNCSDDEDCNGEGHTGVCVNGKCVVCRDDDQCGAGQSCTGGRCETIQGYCDDETPCGAGERCRQNRCEKRVAEVRECAEDMPCPKGQSCQNGHCVAESPGGPGCRTFTPPYFSYESYEMPSDAKSTLNRLAKCMTTGTLRSSQVLLTGHCDPRGEDEFNMALGAHRAETVRAFLIGAGISPNRVKTSSRGKLDASGTDEAGWANDRRVDIEIR